MDLELDLSALINAPRLQQLRDLTFCVPARDAARDDLALWRALAPSQTVALRRLSLEFSPISEEALIGLLGAPWLSDLRALCVLCPRNNLWAGICRALAEGMLPRLLGLEVDSRASSEDVSCLAAWQGLARLRELTFENSNDLSLELKTLLDSPFFGVNLRSLGFVDCELTEADILALAQCPRLSRLQVLRLDFQNLTGAAVEAIATSPYLQQLEKLHIAGHAGSEVDADALADPRRLPRLRDMAVNHRGTVTPSAGLRRRFGPRLRLFRP
jgi:hypothetical protein